MVIYYSIISFTFIFIVYALVFEKHKKGKKVEYFFIFIILICISFILFSMAMPTSFHDPNVSIRNKCYTNQRILLSAIVSYNMDNTEIFPKDCNDIDLEKFQKELLVNNKYLKEPVYPSKYCTFIIIDDDLFCIQHGSFDSDSPHFTNGFVVPGFEKYNKVTEQKGILIREFYPKELERILNISISILGLIGALKFFIFIFL